MNSEDGFSSDEDHSSIHSHSSSCLSGSNWDSDEDTCTEIDLPEGPNHSPDDFVYEVLTVEEIVKLQRDIIDDVTNVLELSPQVTRTILNHFKWNKERLFENYFESSPEEFFQRAHVLNPFEQKVANVPKAVCSQSLSAKKQCGICFCGCDDLKGLGCGHSYCAACWKQYLANKTCSEGLSHMITCPAPNCDMLVDYGTFLKIADDPQVVERYERLITSFFVECNALMRWCPAPKCIHAIKANSTEPKAVRCRCGHRFCFGCTENWHAPVACSWLRKWLSNSIMDSETARWIDQNTKRCPQCGMAIQKDGGCDRMVCTNRCRYEFCWQCLGKWHPSTVCSHHTSSKLVSEQAFRYQLHKDSYLHHMNNWKKEHKLYAKFLAKCDDNQAEISWVSKTKYLRNPIDALLQCRSTLMYSYVFSFYLKDNNQKLIFEYNQKDLETATEKISGCLKLEAENNLDNIKKRLIELSKYCQQRRLNLLNHVQEGNEKDWWETIEEAAM